MAVKIKLKRIGKIRHPQYRIIVADSRTKRDGRALAEVGYYDPMINPSVIKVNSERVAYWLGVGAKPTETVQKLLTVTGDWQSFTGVGDPAGTLEVAPARADKSDAYAEAVVAAASADNEKAAKQAAAKVRGSAEAADEVAVEALAVVDAAADAEAAEVEAGDAPAESAEADSKA